MPRTVNLADMHIPKDSGEKISFMGMDLVWKITSAMSDGAYVVFMQVAPPGSGVPMHIHHREEEEIFLVEGEVLFALGDSSNTLELGPGDMVNMPKGTPHGFRIVGDKPAQILFTLDLSPGSDYETMFGDMVGLAPEEFDKVREVCARNEVEFFAPPQMP